LAARHGICGNALGNGLSVWPFPSYPLSVLVYAIRDSTPSPDHPLGQAVDVFIRREDADRFIEDVRRDEPELPARLRVELAELESGDVN
jgi:hypothetical protein